MEIQKKTFQVRNDFNAILRCQYCGHTQELRGGYDSEHYRNEVIPRIRCKNCDRGTSN